MQQVIAGFHHCLATLARTGNNLIVDHVLQDPAWREECRAVFSDLPVLLLVQVWCPLPELKRREVARGDREVGLARFQYETVYRPEIYDLKLDTSQCMPEACAQAIIRRLHTGGPYRGFGGMEGR